MAVCGGSGGDLAEAAAAAGADVLLTSDLKHHRSSEALADLGIALVDAAHWATEQPWVVSAAALLAADLRDSGTNVEITPSTIVTDPGPCTPTSQRNCESRTRGPAPPARCPGPWTPPSTASRTGARRCPSSRASTRWVRGPTRSPTTSFGAETEDSDLGREQARVDADVEMVRGRMTRDQQRLDGGQVGSPRELENLQSEIESLHRRQAELEDAELEVMEQREVIQCTAEDAAGRAGAGARCRSPMQTQPVTRRGPRSTPRRHLDGHARRDRRDAAGDLIALYEKLRASSGGVGAAALHRGRCEGCHLQLNTTDLNRLRDAPDDEVVRCEECRRILVRTDESGL